MEHSKHNRSDRKGKHLTREERVVIERMSRGGRPPRDIAEILGRHVRSIERELNRGEVEHLDSQLRVKKVYSSDRGQDVYDLNATAKGPNLKLGSNRQLAEFIRHRIVDKKESPDVVAFRMREAGLETLVCTKTLYNYIDQGLIEGVSNQSLWQKRRTKRSKRTVHRHRKRPQARQSIEKRPEHINLREEFGHWEMDLVVGPVGGPGDALLTLVERKHRVMLIRKLPDKSQTSVLKALRCIERSYRSKRFREIFKTITVDNGSEFLDVEGLETSAFSREQRTQIFYAHPYSAWERGSNENANRMLRRFVEKGRDIAAFTIKRISEIEAWINNYPRRLLDFKTPHGLFEYELATITT